MRAFHAPMLMAFCALGTSVGNLEAAGLTQRLPNTTLQMPANPQTFGFTTTNAFGNLAFADPVVITAPPGETNRLFIVEQNGVVTVITNLANPTRTVFMDIAARVAGGVPTDERGLLGLAFHPGYATNRYFYVFYTTTGTLRDRLSRFEISTTNPNQGLTNSEVVLIDQVDQASNHNGGDIHFGPDGYLYITLGDEGDANDSNNNSQRIDKGFFAGIIRIDVDKRPGNPAPNPHASVITNATGSANYSVPADNPFVGATSFNGSPVNPALVRAEFWATGLRNPWRMSFDPDTGILYCGDVGQDAREEIDVIVKGGNYGWNYREGTLNGPRAAPAGFSSIRPIVEYNHGMGNNQGNSVTGGVLYRGKRISQLFGFYVFADYVSGRIWAARPDGTNAVPFQLLATDGGIAGFGVDPSNGEVLIADQSEDRIKRLVYNSTPTGVPLPATLADTGAFSDLATLTPHEGITPYDLNVPFWSDNARKTRWFSVPNTNLTIGFNASGNWSFPTGAVWIKHFDLELTNGVPESTRRLETRFIVRNAGGVYGVTYRWDSLTNATLVPEGGLDEELVIDGGATTRTQVWHYPSRSECLACHTTVSGGALGFNTAQLNKNFDYGTGAENQIAALSRVGYFSTPVTNVNALYALAPSTNGAHSLEYRVRSYLAANCAQCHQPGGPAIGFWDARLNTPLSQAGIINGNLHNVTANQNSRVIVPGSIENSALLTRISVRGSGQMPPIASNVLDTNAIALVTGWVTNGLANYQSFPEWQTANFGSTNAPNTTPDADPDNDDANNTLEYLTGTNPLQGGDAWEVAARRSGNTIEITFDQIANRGFEVQWTDTLSSPILWRTLDTPANRPFISATNFTATVTDTFTNSPAKYYRVRVFEP